MLRQQRDVLAPLAERRNRDVDDVESIVKIFPERAGADLREEVAVGGRHETHVRRDVAAVVSNALDFTGLDESQQQRLHPQAHFPDLVHEERAAVGHLEQAGAIAPRAREAAADVAEKFRFQEGFRNAGAIERDERRAAPPAPAVNEMRHDLLADAAFAGYEYLGVGRGRVPDVLEDGADGQTSADQLAVVLIHPYAPSRRRVPVD